MVLGSCLVCDCERSLPFCLHPESERQRETVQRKGLQWWEE